MKSKLTVLLFSLLTILFSEEIFNKELLPAEINTGVQKDSSWCSYYSEKYFLWEIEAERSTLIRADDFGFEYPVYLHGVTSYLYDQGFNYSYKVYAKDGITLLWNSVELESVQEFNDVIITEPILITDDFYLSVDPDSTGMPRQVSSNITGSANSYTYEADRWQPFISETERYEWVTAVLLSQYGDIDIYPPVVRSLTGNDRFMDIDAKLELTVQDPNGIVSPIQSEYSFDSGNTWIPFQMNSAKSNYDFVGTIPGQPDGISGSVRFYLEDSLGNNVLTSEYPLTWSKDKLLLDEGFENLEFPPAGWSMQIIDSTGVGFAHNDGTGYTYGIFSGNYSAFHSDAGIMNFNDDWLITPLISLPLDNSVTLTFWQMGFEMRYILGGRHEIAVSTDTVNWDVIYTGYPPIGEGNGEVWEELSLSLQAYAGQDIYIGFHYVGDYEDQWYIDDVKVLFDYTGPEIISIAANPALAPQLGTYVYSDMNIDLEVADESGVSSVTGHYTFDGGVSFTDVVFNKQKPSTELWTGIIPTMATESAGAINFSMVDAGGNPSDSDQYDIFFVADDQPSQIEEFKYSSPVFVNDSMDITILVREETFIDSVKGYYSNDNWTTQIEIPMTASKLNLFTYTGNIPAEPVEILGKVKFSVFDTSGNILNSKNYTVEWLEGSRIYYDDFDYYHEITDWDFTGGSWGYNSDSYYSPVRSMSDSPYGNYYGSKENLLTTKEFDLSGILSGEILFKAQIDLEDSFDFFYVEATTDSGATWTELEKFTGSHPEWTDYSVDIGSVVQNPQVRFRFKVVSDNYIEKDGVNIDDITLAGYTNDHSKPLVTYNGPESMVIGVEGYTFDIELTDISNISEAKVVYTIDGGAEQEAFTLIGTGESGIYSLTIPAAPSFSKVRYRLIVTDNSPYNNISRTPFYEVYFGNYLYYENGYEFIDFYDVIGSGQQASAYAIAKRITMGPLDSKDHYRADLTGLTIGNYNTDDDPSDDMVIHVWSDAGGYPGADLITPFAVQPASSELDPYEVTFIDLRPYSAELNGLEGDIFVGFTSAGTGSNIMYEVASNYEDVVGYQKFNRTWIGEGNELGINWILDEADVYHISAITGPYTLVDIPLPPLNLTGRGGEGSVILNWTESSDDDIHHYNIYRADSLNFTISSPIGITLSSEGTEYVDFNPAGGDENGNFYYKVTAVDNDGDESDVSNEVMVDPTGIENNIPLITQLYQNYPNPFNPETEIRFSIAQDSNVELSVFNSKGELIETILSGEFSKGYYSAVFNGSRYVSGIYYYSLISGEKSFVKKMLMIK